MNKLPQNLIELEKAVVQLADKPGFQNVQCVVNSVIGLLGIDGDDKWKLFSDSNGKIRSNSGWFMLAEGFADKRASYKIADDNSHNLDIKAYWMKNISKAITSWLVALTPNFEDEPFYQSKNIGIDFIIPEKADRVIVVLSNNYVIRTLELSQSLSLTQKEIFHKWLQDFDFENKAQVHENLWHSFDLESVNKAFYKQISSFFVELKQHLADNKIFDERHAALFANRLIGRVIFCWFLDKKGFINSQQKYFELEGENATEYYQLKLEKLFFRTLNKKIKDRGEDVYNLIGGIDEKTPFLNGGLFTAKEGDHFGERNAISFPADYFDRLYAFLKHYNFTTDESTSSFQQVAIDPEMLGRVFENLLAEQIEETGEQARKAKGAFYTPREIVEYMCKESLREYLKSKIEKTEDSEQRISQLLDFKPHEWRDQQRNYREKLKKYKFEILEALEKIRVIDPACGSGAFPMGMLQLLLQTYERLDSTFDSYKKKLEIIKENLFGIDIEPMAVEIARLRSWLSIIVDEELNPNAENMGIHPLPNLEFKFVCANSLIPAPVEEENSLFEDSFFTELEQKAEEFFEINDVEKKEAKKHELQKLVDRKVREKLDNAGQLSVGLNMGKFEGEIKKKNQKAIDENIQLFHLWSSYTNIFTADEPVGFFETKYFFPSAKDGFDVVIGNPPYVGESGHKDIFRNIRNSLWGKKFYKDKMDLFYFFFHKSLDLVENEGIVSLITTNYYVTATGALKLRKDFYERAVILKLMNFNNLKIFPSAMGQHNMITFLKKVVNREYEARNAITKRTGLAATDILQKIVDCKDEETDYFSVLQKNIYEDDDYYIRLSGLGLAGDDPTQAILKKMKTQGELLGTVCNINQGIVTGANFLTAKNKEKYEIRDVSVGSGIFLITNEELEELNLTSNEYEIIKPLFKNSDIYKYSTNNDNDLNLINLRYTDRLDIEKYPNLKNHLLRFQKLLIDRPQTGTLESAFSNNFWYVMTTSRKANFEGPKIVVPYRSPRNIFGYNEIPWFGITDIYFITARDKRVKLKYLLALLNSKLFYVWLYHKGKRKGEILELFQKPLSEIPVKIISESDQDLLIKVVDKILERKKDDPEMDTSDLEEEIDQLVYKLYKLTPEEIQIIQRDA